MSKYLIGDTLLSAIADEIRAQEGTTAPIPVSELASRISALELSGIGTLEEILYNAPNQVYSVDNTTLTAIGNAIREKSGVAQGILVRDFAKYIRALKPAVVAPNVAATYYASGSVSSTSTTTKLAVNISNGLCTSKNNILLVATTGKQKFSAASDISFNISSMSWNPSYVSDTNLETQTARVDAIVLPKGFSGKVNIGTVTYNSSTYPYRRMRAVLLNNVVYKSKETKVFNEQPTLVTGQYYYSYSSAGLNKSTGADTIDIIFVFGEDLLSSYTSYRSLKYISEEVVPSTTNGGVDISIYKSYNAGTLSTAGSLNFNTKFQRPTWTRVTLNVG